ncbi:MAG TPA: EAL domain-containing protein [Rhodanobacteraceae bacterium]|nr:EAL domain-containing protein [Rhodanobacteraceae bacterium]
MAAHVYLLPKAVPADQPAPTATALLQASGSLWAAPDLDAVVAAAGALLDELVPGTLIERCDRNDIAAFANRASGYPLQITLSRDEVLVVTAPCNRDCRVLLDAAAELIAARIDALDQRTALANSVEQIGRSERLQRALYAIADQASAAGTDLTPMFNALHAIVGSLMYAENFYITLYDAKQDSVQFPYYADTVDAEPPSPGSVFSMAGIEHGPTWYVLHDGKPLMGSPESMSRYVNGPFHMVGAVCKDWLGVPLLHGTEVVGCVVVQSYDKAHHYNEQDKALLIYVAQHIQTALERRLAHAELERRVEERTIALSKANDVLQQEVLERQRGERLQTTLFRIAELAGSNDGIDAFYASIHRVVGDLINARNFCIALVSEDGTELGFPYSVDECDRENPTRKLANGLTEHVLRHGAPLLVDKSEITRLRASGEVGFYGSMSECWLGVPLVCAEHTVGALVVQSYSPEHRYTQRDQELLTFVSYHIANALERIRAKDSLQRAYAQLENRVDERTRALALANRDLRAQITERERIEARLKYETLHDSLTGLPNRTLLMQRLEHALAGYHADPSQGFAVLFMDLDRFKVINDSVGHLVGDDLLLQVGNRIRDCLKSEDVVARLGGDEFGVLLEGITDADKACRIAKRIIDDLNAPFRLAAKELFTSTSIGIALAAPHYQNPDELLRDADSAMYRAKADGRHRYAVFDDDLRKEAVSLLEVENDLRRGLTRNEFVPYYQPVVDLENGNIVGYEALMRWRHPQRGVLLPGAFLNVAEDTGTSETIDWQIFTQVCRDANALVGNSEAFVAINLSARHFGNPQFDRRLLGLLAEYAVPPSRLRVEVTERALLENTPVVKHVLQVFRDAGISISLDDFGTGYSSLSYLHQYPLQTLKIDRSFVANLSEGGEGSSDAVIRAILAMAETLSIQVIAEGVETPLQRDMLRQLGCRLVQGFLYSKAQPVDTWIGDAAPNFAAVIPAPEVA